MKKNVLVTAGSTWIKIDEVRVLTNRFTGRTGLELARELQNAGCNVTVLVNPHCVSKELSGLKVVKFYYYDELKDGVARLLKKQKFDAIIHTAAVSDYYLPDPACAKIPSGKKALVLKLTPTQKIIKLMRAQASRTLLVQFKLENSTKGLVEKAYKSLKSNDSDFVVANALDSIGRKYLIGRDARIVEFKGVKSLAVGLAKIINNNE